MAIEQHPIPQDVAGYKFRLIGEMTVKQFIWFAGGIIAGLITYSLPLPFFFKYPLVGIFVGLGAGIAFLPIEGRPMDKWLIAFIKSVYSPTQYTWQKSGNENATQTPQILARPVTQTATPVPASANPTPTQKAVSSVTPTPTQVINAIDNAAQTPVVQNTTPINQAPAPVAQATISTPSVMPVPPKPATDNQPVINATVIPPTPPKPITPPTSASPIPPKPISGNLPIPFTPTTPNTLVGMTLTPDGKILDGCLIEIKSGGVSMRATKSNQLGQFLFAKPLENGVYQIFTEKSGYTFDSYSLNLTGQIIKPLRLQAKANV